MFIAAFDDIEASLERANERADANARETAAAIRGGRESIRAHTEALLAVLDRFGPATG